MTNKNVLVTGGAGYIGSHMVRTLFAEGFNPVVLDNLSTGHKELVPHQAKFIKGDLRNLRDIRKVFSLFRFSSVIHFAGSALVSESIADPIRYYENNLLSSINLIKMMLETGVGKIVFSSSCSVYGASAASMINETCATNPVSVYGRTKLMIENLLKDISQNKRLAYISLRYFNVAGAHHSGETGEWHHPESHLIPNVLKAALDSDKQLVIFGDDYPTFDGTCIRDYVHVEDLCNAHALALKALIGNADSETLNIGTGKGYSVREVIRRAEKVSGRKVNVKIAPRRAGDPAKLVSSFVRAKNLLGWRPIRDLNEIIESAWTWEQSLKNRLSKLDCV